jgi:aminodeoxyfutalosine deaminase
VRLTPDITRGASLEEAFEAVRYAVKYRECGIVGIGLGGEENLYPPEPFAPAFRAAKEAGVASVPHAGEVVGPSSVRGALEALEADRIRHGIRAVDDPGLVREIAGRRLVLDVCPISNLRTGAVRSLDEHPLPQLVAAGIPCSISTDYPEMFDTDLSREYAAATSLGLSPQLFYDAGVEGALCDSKTKSRLEAVGNTYDWSFPACAPGAARRPPCGSLQETPRSPPARVDPDEAPVVKALKGALRRVVVPSDRGTALLGERIAADDERRAPKLSRR